MDDLVRRQIEKKKNGKGLGKLKKIENDKDERGEDERMISTMTMMTMMVVSMILMIDDIL